MKLPPFETERLLIGPIAPGHASFMMDLLNTEGWLRFIGNRNIQSIADAGAYIEKIRSNPDYCYMVYQHRHTGQFIGLVSLLKRDYLADYDIGFAQLPVFDKQGFAYEASSGLLRLVESSGFCAKVVAITLPDNQPSIALLTKLGLVPERQLTEGDKTLLVYQKTFVAPRASHHPEPGITCA